MLLTSILHASILDSGSCSDHCIGFLHVLFPHARVPPAYCPETPCMHSTQVFLLFTQVASVLNMLISTMCTHQFESLINRLCQHLHDARCCTISCPCHQQHRHVTSSIAQQMCMGSQCTLQTNHYCWTRGGAGPIAKQSAHSQSVMLSNGSLSAPSSVCRTSSGTAPPSGSTSASSRSSNGAVSAA